MSIEGYQPEDIKVTANEAVKAPEVQGLYSEKEKTTMYAALDRMQKELMTKEREYFRQQREDGVDTSSEKASVARKLSTIGEIGLKLGDDEALSHQEISLLADALENFKENFRTELENAGTDDKYAAQGRLDTASLVYEKVFGQYQESQDGI